MGWEWWQAPATEPKRNRWHSQRWTSVTAPRRAVSALLVWAGGCLKSHDGLAHGSGFLSSSGALFASAQRWSFGERACAVRCWGRASLWAGVSRRVRGWQARAFSARFSPPTCASCGRTGSARALLPPPADLGQYPGYRRAGGGGCSRAARVGCNAETASVRRRLSHRRPAAVPWGALRRSCAAFACAPRSGMCPREDDLSRQPARAGVYPGRARKAVIYSYSQDSPSLLVSFPRCLSRVRRLRALSVQNAYLIYSTRVNNSTCW